MTSSAPVCEQAFRAFIRAYGCLRQHMEPYFARFGISGAQWGVLRALHRAADEGCDGLRLTDLGTRLLIKPPSVTTVVDRLERMRLVARTPVSGDQRAKQVRLTPAGKQLLARVLRRHPGQIRGVMDGLTPAEQIELNALMEKLATHLQSVAPGDGTGVKRTTTEPRGTSRRAARTPASNGHRNSRASRSTKQGAHRES